MGNWINKEWSQQVNSDDDESNKENSSMNPSKGEVNGVIDSKSKSKFVRKKVSSLLSNSGGDNYGEYSRVSTAVTSDATPVSNSKVVMAEFDPRSPSAEIVRTPIYLADNNANGNNESKKQAMFKKTILNNLKLSMIDPRSPSNDYNRTPIQITNKYNLIGQDQNDSINIDQPNLNDSGCQDSENVDNGIQQVPEKCLFETSKDK